MRDLLILFLHLVVTVARLIGPGGARAIVADSLLMKQQLLVLSRTRRRCSYHQVINTFEIPRSTQETEIPVALFLSPKKQARAQRPIQGTHPDHR